MRNIGLGLGFGGLLLAAGFPLAGAAPSKPVAEWNFKFQDNLIWIEVGVDGSRPLRFILDSASTHHVISTDAAEKLGLSTGADTVLVRRTDAVQEQSTTAPVELKVGGAFALKNVSLLVVPLNGIDGIIGLPVFERYLVEIDYAGSKVRLFDPNGPRSDRGESVKLQTRDGLCGIRLADSTGNSGVFVLDTGCSSGLLLSRHASSLFEFCRAYPPEAHVLYAGGDIPGRRYRQTSWQLGSQTVPGVETVVCSKATDGLLADSQWAGLVGNGFLAKFKVTFDFPGHRMFLEPAK